MTQTVGQELARKTVLTRMSQLRLNPADIARRAEVDAKTVGAFLEGKRWSQLATRAAISEAVEWPANYVDLLAAGTLDPTTALVTNEDSQSDEVMGYADIAGLGPRVSGLERQVETLWMRVLELEQLLARGGDGYAHATAGGSTPTSEQGSGPGITIEPDRQGLPEDNA